jgi:hypothetical protein
MKHVYLTPLQIAVLSLAHASFVKHPPPAKNARHPEDVIAVWGSWEQAANQLRRGYYNRARNSFDEALKELPLLACLGTATGTRELEWQTLSGRQRRGPAGRKVHLYRLERRAASLAARCAWAIENLPADRQIATWKDIPAELPSPRAGKRCPTCGCEPATPCAVALANDCGEGSCVPAGVAGFRQCSACASREAA